MAEKPIVKNLASLQNESSAIKQINENFNNIADRFTHLLSSTAPTALNIDFDMNGYRLLNLPEPVSPTEPVRLQDVIKYTSSGIRGEKGDPGPAGPPGERGFTGPVGPIGQQGIQGIQGVTGAVGPRGIQGVIGPAGVKGDTGTQGIQGLTGSTGPQGLQGNAGPQGIQGVAGPAGAKGDTGAGISLKGAVNTPADLPSSGVVGDTYIVTGSGTGYASGDGYTYIGGGSGTGTGNNWRNVGPLRGPKGDTGTAGTQGAQGPQGLTGAQGAKGDTGLQGPQGAKGDTGATGPQGPQGTAGATGATGPQGPTGATGPAPDTSTFARLAGASFSGSVYSPYFEINSAGATSGFASLGQGGSSNTGTISFFDKTSKRHGYVGFASGTGLNVASEVGPLRLYGAGDGTYNNATLWHAGNFNPDAKADKSQLGSTIPGINWVPYETRILATKIQQPGEAQPLIDFQVDTRDGTIDGGGGIGTSISLTTRGRPGTKYGQFGLLSLFENRSVQASNEPSFGHVSEAPYMFVYNKDAPASWAIAAEVREFTGTADPTYGRLVCELGLFATGTDANNQRTALFLPANKHDVNNPTFTEFANGIYWNTTPGTKYKNAMYLTGQYDTVLNANNLDAGTIIKATGNYSGPAIDLHLISSVGDNNSLSLNNAHNIAWRDANNTLRGVIGRDGDTMILTGVKQSGEGFEFNINGARWRFAATRV